MNPPAQHDPSPDPAPVTPPQASRARLIAGTVAMLLLGGVAAGVLFHMKARSQDQQALTEKKSPSTQRKSQKEKDKPKNSASRLWSAGQQDHRTDSRSRLSPLAGALEGSSPEPEKTPPSPEPPPARSGSQVRLIQVSDNTATQHAHTPSGPAAGQSAAQLPPPPFPPAGETPPGQAQAAQQPPAGQLPPPPSQQAAPGRLPPAASGRQLLPGVGPGGETSGQPSPPVQQTTPPQASPLSGASAQQMPPAAQASQSPGTWGNAGRTGQAAQAPLPAKPPAANAHQHDPTSTAPATGSVPGVQALPDQAAGATSLQNAMPQRGESFPGGSPAPTTQQAAPQSPGLLPRGGSAFPPPGAASQQAPGGAGAFDPFGQSGSGLPGGPQPVPPPTGTPAARQTAPSSLLEGALSEGITSPEESGPLGTGLPNRQWEGPQTASVEIEKQAPEEIQIGKPAVFVVLVKNTGRVPATDVEVIDLVPKGTRLLQTRPAARVQPGGRVVWQLDVLQPGEQRQVQMEVLPLVEGEVGSVATVRYSAASSARTVATRPELRVQVQAPRKVHIGQEVTLQITITNPGTGPATGVILTEHVPEGLQHPIGNVLEYEVGDLKPKETRQLELTLKAVKPGRLINHLVARGDGQLRDEARNPIEVIAPALQVAVKGPRFRYLEREATYQITISNPGTAPAKEIELAAQIPPGFKFLEANNYGEFDANTRTVYWSLVELPPGQSGTVTLRLRPEESGQRELLVEAKAQHDLIHRVQHRIKVEGVAALRFEVADIDDPVEVGGETFYEITVVNQGTKAATDVQLVALLPEGLQPIGAEGPVRFRIAGRQVLFDRLPRLSPKAQTTYRIRVRGVRAGDHRIRVQMVSAELRAPVVKEESTRVFGDPEP